MGIAIEILSHGAVPLGLIAKVLWMLPEGCYPSFASALVLPVCRWRWVPSRVLPFAALSSPSQELFRSRSALHRLR